MVAAPVVDDVVEPVSLNEDDTCHVTCCHSIGTPLVAFCGTDVTGQPEVPVEFEATCVVCADLARTPWCPRFGSCVVQA